VRRLRVRYEQAKQSLEREGLCRRKDSNVKAFVKGEKLSRYKISKPRVIMGRDPRYNLELASYLKPVEHAIYGELRGFGKQFLTHTRLVAKGLGLKERANLIRKKMSSRAGIVAMEIDGKSFESHFCREVLMEEHRVYTDLCPSARLKQLLAWQLSFKGKSDGVRFKAAGVRASGDFNTGMGNSLVMTGLVLATARCVGKRFDFLVDGDNAVLFVIKEDLDLWRDMINPTCVMMGFEMVLERPVGSLEEVVFGQSKPFLGPEGWTMVRDPFKVISHAACGYQHYGEMVGGLRVLKSVAYCEAVLNRGVPVLQAMAHALLRATEKVLFSKAEPESWDHKVQVARGYNWAQARWAPVTAEARSGFEKSWGVSMDAQLVMEAVLSKGFIPPSSWVNTDLEVTLPDGRDLVRCDSLAPWEP
jgi:hypothetical protein